MKRVMLYFGSFNPIHNGHIALAEYVVAAGLCDELIMVVSPQNPLKSTSELAPELERFTMAEMAATSSKFPEQIKASVIEFMLPKPSYTINTLRHLSSEYGHMMEFSILMGGDLVEQLDKWRDYEEILDGYPIYIYPRRGERVERYLDRITLLEGAPLCEVSSTQIREMINFDERVDGLLPRDVLNHIRESGFWRCESEQNEGVAGVQRYIERGRYHYQREAWGEAVNSFNRALRIDPTSSEAQQLLKMTQQILEYRYTEIYNP